MTRQPSSLRRYAWNAGLRLSILTNFEEFAVYNCTRKPLPTDKASDGRDAYFTYRDYPSKWEWIVSLFAQESILKGSFDRFAISTKGKKGTAGVDEDILTEIEQWRDSLARNFAFRNTGLSVEELNTAVQGPSTGSFSCGSARTGGSTLRDPQRTSRRRPGYERLASFSGGQTNATTRASSTSRKNAAGTSPGYIQPRLRL